MKRILTIYVNLQDKRVQIPEFLQDKIFIVAICPFSISGGLLSQEGIEEIKEFLRRGCLLGQRGYLGRCKYPHKDGTDPWHENFCLYNPPISFEEQLEFMKKGKKILAETFGVEPAVYCPINHLYDESTISAVQTLKYRFIMDRNVSNIVPYARDRIIIIPESNLPKEKDAKGQAIYVSIESLREKEVLELLKSYEIISPTEIIPENVLESAITINEIEKRSKKMERDSKNLREKEEKGFFEETKPEVNGNHLNLSSINLNESLFIFDGNEK